MKWAPKSQYLLAISTVSLSAMGYYVFADLLEYIPLVYQPMGELVLKRVD